MLLVREYIMNDIKSIKNMSFEEALKELELIVRRLDSGQESLETAVISYERASELKALCELKLAEAKLKIEKVSKASDGTISLSEENM